MHRQGRLHVPYGTYFVINNFRPGLEVLVPDPRRRLDPFEQHRLAVHRKRFEALLEYLCRRWCVRVHAYCWLPNSALLLIEISREPLESVMRSLRSSYSRILGNRSSCYSPLFRGRYRALLIDPDEYLLEFARHILQSPVKAALCRSPLAYEHSGAGMWTAGPVPPFLYTDSIVRASSERGLDSADSLKAFLGSEPTPNFTTLLAQGSKLDSGIAGNPAFVEKMHGRTRVVHRPADLEDVVAWVSSHLRVPIPAICCRSRQKESVQARALVAWLATSTGSSSLRDVARRLSHGPSALNRAIRDYSRSRPALFSLKTLQEFEQTVVDARSGSEVRTVPDREGGGECASSSSRELPNWRFAPSTR